MCQETKLQEFRDGHKCLGKRGASSSLRFFRSNRGFTRPDWISLSHALERGLDDPEKRNNQEWSSLCHTQDVLWGGSRQKPTSWYLNMEPVGTGQRWLGPYFQEPVSAVISRNPFLSRLSILGWTSHATELRAVSMNLLETQCKCIPAPRKAPLAVPLAVSHLGHQMDIEFLMYCCP